MKRSKGKRKLKVKHVIAAIIFIYGLTIIINQHKMIERLNNEKVKKEAKVEKLEKEVKNIEAKTKESKTEEYIEKIAREKGMIKSNEIIYIDKNKKKNDFLRRINN